MRYFYVFIVLWCVLSWLGDGQPVFAQVRSSSNYQIESDSINVGGGFSTSTNFVQESTVGEVATGQSGSANYNLYAGYQQMQVVYLALTPASDVSMSPALSGMTGGESDGSTSMNVVTDGRAGYQLLIKAVGVPALQSALSSIADYVPAGSVPDAMFTTAATDSHFGYSAYGTDMPSRFLVNAGVCGSGSAAVQTCWDGLSTNDAVIAERHSSNQPGGSTTTVYFKVGIGSSVNQAPGVYTATTTVTAIPL